MTRPLATRPPALALMGPTAMGKTALAIELCREYPFEIISVDSALVYRGLDIGAARPSAEELAAAPHRLLGICDPAEPYSVARFREDALRAMTEITAAGRIPLLVGGTMLYFKALREGLAALPETDPALRARIEAEAARRGWPALHAELAEVDPAAAARIHPRHSQRIQRALEVWHASGRSLSDWQARQVTEDLPWRLLQLALIPLDRPWLHRRIERRFRAMLDLGLVDEVRALRARGDLHPGLPAVRAVGYRQVWEYLDGEVDYDTMVARGIAATRQLAKRQLTWLRGWPDLHCLCLDGEERVRACTGEALPETAAEGTSALQAARIYLESHCIGG